MIDFVNPIQQFDVYLKHFEEKQFTIYVKLL